MTEPIEFLNLDHARFECTFGRGCEGICCRNGRPPVRTDEAERIESVLNRALPLMRPEASSLVQREGFLSNRVKDGSPMLRVIGGWCVFFAQGCVLHTLGMADGNAHQYKPTVCSLFPVERAGTDQWYVRQAGYLGEQWNELPCLNPTDSTPMARDTLKEEIEIAKRMAEEESSG